MNTLLIFFAFPIAVIIISAILQKLLNCPLAVAALIFAVFIIVTFAAFDETFLIATLAYTILAFITAFLVSRFCNFNSHNNNNCLCNNLSEILQNNINTANSNDSLQDLLENINQNNNNCNNNNNNDDNVLGTSTCGCGCGRVRRYGRF